MNPLADGVHKLIHNLVDMQPLQRRVPARALPGGSKNLSTLVTAARRTTHGTLQPAPLALRAL